MSVSQTSISYIGCRMHHWKS